MLKNMDMFINNFIENQAGDYNDMPRGVTARELVYRAGNMKTAARTNFRRCFSFPRLSTAGIYSILPKKPVSSTISISFLPAI